MLAIFLLPIAFANAGDRGLSPAPYRAWPKPFPSQPTPEVQTEVHTCGFHTLSTIYKAHGLKPDLWRLRERLGTDVPLFSLDETTTGTVQADMVRVLVQDHFQVEALEPNEAGARERILGHLEEGYLAAALIHRRENGNLHWITLVGVDAEQNAFDVLDSVARAGEIHNYKEPYEDFMENYALQILLIRPAHSSAEDLSIFELHAEGWKMMSRSLGLPFWAFILLATTIPATLWTFGLFLNDINARPFFFVRKWCSCLMGVTAGLFTLSLTAYVIPGGALLALLIAWCVCSFSLMKMLKLSWVFAFTQSVFSVIILILGVGSIAIAILFLLMSL